MLELLMGNEAIAVGAMMAGVRVVAGYPGTPSTEVLETVAKRNTGNIYVEWSINEKSALEVAAGAAYSGARALVTMKQVGLNVASDPLMCLNYIGVKGGLVVFVADDPGPISSQTEQDTRHFGKYAKIPVFDPTSPEEAYQMIGDAFELSEEFAMPVILRATTRICHSCASIDVGDFPILSPIEGFVPGKRWVIFPRLSYENKIKLEKREKTLSKRFSEYKLNIIEGSGKIGIACNSISYPYVLEAIEREKQSFTVFKVATPFPFPEALAREFIRSVEQIIVFEELDPVIEDALVYTAGAHGIKLNLFGKRSGNVPCAGELSPMAVSECLKKAFNIECNTYSNRENKIELPIRPPVLCAGCPHRASFYNVKTAMKGKKATFCGDIGCYTLGNAAPLDMVDTCLCMGAGINIAQGMNHAEDEGTNFAFVGDSTFFASGITGVINGFYNQANFVLVVLDNSTTAMTGHQPHPGIGKTMMGEIVEKVSIEKILKAIGLKTVVTLNPLDHEKSVEAIKKVAEKTGVRAIIFKAPCIAVTPKKSFCQIGDSCIGCKKCINELGCPAISFSKNKARISKDLCTGCDLCAQICPKNCIRKEAL